MNREIKFRVWDYVNKSYIDNGEGFRIYDCGWDGEVEYQQFTGLLDSQGKEIYEGDILKLDYIGQYEVFDNSGEFIKWSDENKKFSRFFEVVFYIGDYEINCSEYTIGLNGWAAKQLYDTRKSSSDDTGTIRSLCFDINKYNYGGFGLLSKHTEIIGNILENSELLKS